MIQFYLGSHHPHWLDRVDVPLFIAHHNLADRKTLPRARRNGWALDSGAFTKLKDLGEWDITPEEYVEAVRRYDEEIGNLHWAAPMDWMCEPEIINGGWHRGQYYVGTHLSVGEHQRRTVENFVRLQELWGEGETSPFMPTLQGYQGDDYLRCMDMYAAAGVDLTLFPVVGLGSVCRRQATPEIGQIVSALRAVDPGLLLHGFGVKTRGLELYGHMMESADSTAWSRGARWLDKPVCGSTTHKHCGNCLTYALEWRQRVLDTVECAERRARWRPEQLDMFEAVAS